ncbi:MAG: DUF58 domain-containing protein [Actinobacteria bacterium HGW-Actinobacteria-4]|nr:MAG: DUF58 domain-containing protein [Actinobacteria bacterium HGW-Actinobacteria-4]
MYITWRAVAFSSIGIVVATLASSGMVAWAWLGLTLLLIVLDVASAPSPRALAVRRDTPPSVRLSEATSGTVTVLNMGTRTIRGVIRDAWQPSAGATRNRHDLDLPEGERRRFTTALRPTRRGDRLAGPVTVRILGPLRIAGRQLSLPCPASLRVLPEFSSRRHLPSRLARLRELDGRSAVQIRGPGSEFDSLREYVIGDDVRSIDWRATARRSEVVVRTWRPERDRQVFIVIDTSRTSAARVGDTPRLDAAIEATLLLSALASKAGDRISAIAFDRSVRARVSGISGSALMPALADRLAPLEPRLAEADWSGAVSVIQESLSQRALVVLLTSIDPAAVEAGLLRAIAPVARKHQVVIASVDDPEIMAMMAERGGPLEVYGAAAAARFDLERRAVAEQLRQRGLEVVSADPDSLAPALADTYLALKAAGRL